MNNMHPTLSDEEFKRQFDEDDRLLKQGNRLSGGQSDEDIREWGVKKRVEELEINRLAEMQIAKKYKKSTPVTSVTISQFDRLVQSLMENKLLNQKQIDRIYKITR